MFAAGETADAGQFRRGGGGGGRSANNNNEWSVPLNENGNLDDEMRYFDRLGRAEQRSNAQRGSRKRHRQGFGFASAPGGGGEMEEQNIVPQPIRHIKFDSMVRRQNIEQTRHVLKRRNRSLIASEALANGGDAAQALVAVADDDSSALTEDEAKGVGDLIEVQGEIAAARVHEDAGYFSTCSEDEEVLLETLRLMRSQSCMMAHCPELGTSANKKRSSHVFEEDDEEEDVHHTYKKTKKTAQTTAAAAASHPVEYHESVPDNTAHVFEDLAASNTGTAAAAATASSINDAAGSSESNDNDDDDGEEDLMRPHVVEQEDSRRQRVHRLRVQVHNERRRRGNLPSECFMCMWGNSQYDAVNAQPMHILKQLMESEIGRRDLVAVARTAHKYFKEEIWKKMVPAGKKIPMWRTRDILTHLLHHEREPNLFVYRYTGVLDKLAQTLINQVHVYDPNTGRIMVDRVALHGFHDTVKLLQSFYNSNPRKMTFFDDKASFDLAAAASGQRHGAGGGGSGHAQSLSTIGNYVLTPAEPPHAVYVRNK